MRDGDPTDLPDPALVLLGNPYRRRPDLGSDQRTDLLLTELTAAMGSRQWTWRNDSIWLLLNEAAWDSEQLGVAVGELRVYGRTDPERPQLASAASALIDALHTSNLQVVKARTHTEDHGAVTVLDTAGFVDVGSITTMSRSCDGGLSSPRESGATIRAGTPGDEAAIRALAERYFENHLLCVHELAEERVRASYGTWAVNNLRGRTAMTLVASQAARVIGFLSLDFDGSNPKVPTTGLVDLVVVHPDVRRAGVARALVGEAMRECALRGILKLELGVRDDNEPARRLYSGLGFRRTATFEDRVLTVARTPG